MESIEQLKNTVHQGDCLELMKIIPDASIDMIFCDLPYGTTQNKWDIIIPFNLLWDQYERIIKPNGAIVLTAAEPFASMLRMSNLKLYKYDWAWNKKKPTGFLNSKKRPLVQHEVVCVFYKSQPIYNPQMHTNKEKRNWIGRTMKPNTENYGKQKSYVSAIKEDDLSYPRSVIEISGVIGNSKEKLQHATQKPVALVEYFINTYTNEGAVVLDNCAGSGTTGEACKNTGRYYILMDKEPKYIVMTNERLK
jgi:site-specific DNA-methyltransferase (adenine-specific)